MKTTEELLNILKNKNITEYFADNPDEFVSSPLSECLNKILVEKQLKIPEIAKKSNMFNIYVYEIFSGSKHPSRDKLMQLCFGMNMTFDEVQTLLKHSEYAPLYPRNRRDSIIISAFVNGMTLMQCNELLDAENFSPLT